MKALDEAIEMAEEILVNSNDPGTRQGVQALIAKLVKVDELLDQGGGDE